MIQRQSLGDLLEDLQPGFASGKNLENGTLQVRMNNVQPDGGWNWDKKRRVPATTKQLQKYSLRTGDILFNATNSASLVGKSALFLELDEPVTFSNHFLRLRTKSNLLDPKFLSRYLTYLWGLRVFEHMVDAWVNQATVNRDQFLGLTIPFPPLKEQKRIAAILDKADAIRRKRQQAIELTDLFLRSVFLEMFGDPELSMTIDEWLEEAYLLLHKDGNHGSKYPRKDDFGDIGVPFISAKDISDDDGCIIQDDIALLRIDKANTLTIGWIQQGDILLAHNATVGRVGIFQGEYDRALIGTSLTAFRPNSEKILPQYLFCALKYSGFQNELTRNMGQTTRNQVPITAQRSMSIPIADLELQKRFRSVFDRVKSTRAIHVEALDKIDQCIRGLSHHAFRGDLTKLETV